MITLSSEQVEYCRLLQKLASSCACLPPIWTDCGCTPEIDPDASTFSSAGSVEAFVNALNFCRAFGSDFNFHALPFLGSGAVKTVGGVEVDSQPDTVMRVDTEIKPVVFAALELTIDSRVADTQETWFALDMCYRADGGMYLPMPSSVMAGTDDSDVTDFMTNENTIRQRIRFKLKVDSPKRLYIPVLKLSPTALAVLRNNSVPVRDAGWSYASIKGATGTPTAALILAAYKYLSSFDATVIAVRNQPQFDLYADGSDDFPYSASLKFVSQDSAQTLRALKHLESVI